MAEVAGEKTRLQLSAVLIAVWAAVLIIAFLTERESDVWQIAKLFENLGGGPFIGSGIAESFAGLVVAALIGVAWFGAGSFAVSLIRAQKTGEHSHILEFAMKAAVGAAIWSLAWFFLGIAGWYSPAVSIAAVMVGLGLCALEVKRAKKTLSECSTPERPSGFDKLLMALIAVPVFLSLVASLAPPTAKDTLLYHFAVPKVFLQQASNAFIEGNIASYLALGTEMHSVWAMLLGDLVSSRAAEAAAGATIWIFFPALLAAIFGWAREIGISRRWSLLATLMVGSVPTAYHVAASAYIDLALALYITLAIYALSRWWRSGGTGWLAVVTVFLGAALSSKLTTVFVIAAFALIILLRLKKAKDSGAALTKDLAVKPFAAIILAGVLAAPWYLRTWNETGSPLFPFYLSIIPAKAPGWDTDRSLLFQQMNSQYGGYEKSALDYLLAPWNLSVTAQPEVATHFDGVLGAAFLIGLPILLFGLWRQDLSVEVKIGSGVAVIVFLFWLFTSQQLRYLLPIMPVLAIGIAAAVEAIDARRKALYRITKYSITAAAVCALLTTVAWFMQKAPLKVVLGGESREEYLARLLDYYPYYEVLNSTSATDAKVWLINMRRDTYHLHRPVVSDYLFEDWTLRKLVWESRDAAELKAKAASLGAEYILTRHDFLFDYDRSSLVDDKRPRSENEVRLRMARDLVLDPARSLRADRKFSLVKLF